MRKSIPACPKCKLCAIVLDGIGVFPVQRHGRWRNIELARATCRLCSWNGTGYIERNQLTVLGKTQVIIAI